jgi:hypothetical protein
MDATPISYDTATPYDAPPIALDPFGEATGRKWAALHDAAAVVAALAGESPGAAPLDFADLIGKVPSWRRELARQGVEDLVAIMEPGLAALIAVHTGGGDASAPASALWQEFTAARDALVALTLPHD